MTKTWKMTLVLGVSAPWANEMGWKALPAWIFCFWWPKKFDKNLHMTGINVFGLSITMTTGPNVCNELRLCLRF